MISIRETTEKIKIRIRNPAKLRNLELFLLLVAFGIAGAAICLVQLGVNGTVDWWLLYLAGGLGVITFAMHIAMRFVAREADPLILPIVTVLNGLGIAMIYRIDLAQNAAGWGSTGVRQIAWTALAMVIGFFVLVLIRNHRVLARFRYIAMLGAIVLLILPIIPGLGRRINGAQVWINVAGSTFQPGEIAKILLAIFFAGYLMTARDSLSVGGRKFLWMRFPRMRDLGPLVIVWAASMFVLVFQRDLGTSMLYFGLFLVMVYVATGKSSWIVLGVFLVGAGGTAAYLTLGYVQRRIDGWINAFSQQYYEAAGGSFQIVQGIFGMAQGGLLGTGLGQGRPQVTPYSQSDYIFASLGEELGLIGVFAILALYLLLVSRGLRIGFNSPDDFTKLLGVGLSFVIALQVFIVVGGITRVIPLTGLTMPFLAAGGSSLLANWIICALLLRLSDTVRSQRRMVVER
ncbi:FtsW/RodA/SpoVE family cell cycle protein [Humidisolicoccus flavus]|uniref:FtsW/RodA/SpoVE family cell cycle protein n=1 Tax=Humidisolicoccus flavus TaxID=3111414 RepID=UPI003244282C